MKSDKGIKLDNYERGLIISLINQVNKCGHDFSPDEIVKLNSIKKQLQEEYLRNS
jgi:hypothetical protein